MSQHGMVPMTDITAGEMQLEWTTGQPAMERIDEKNHTESSTAAAS
jgi:hypothetical protein